jgi:uncharacterized integral membrane protein
MTYGPRRCGGDRYYTEGATMKPKTIVIIVLTILLTILVIQNTHSVEVNIFFWKPDFPLIILILIVMGIGFGLGFFSKNIIGMIQKKGDDY